MGCRVHIRGILLPALAAALTLSCAAAVRPVTEPAPTPLSSFWQAPDNLRGADLFLGPWGAANAPDPRAEYVFLRSKIGGFNPGVVVRDPQGREWHVKQPASKSKDEGPSEVLLSRVLSALGYHQPPVYYLPSFQMRDRSGVHTERGGRFRLDLEGLKDLGEWSWQQNPFVGQRPYQGLLVILLLFNSSDLKNSNNTLYEFNAGNGLPARRWFVVRDLGAALGRTGRVSPPRNDIEAFTATRFITGGAGEHVEFDYHGLHQELVDRRITREDVAWAARLIGGLDERQWRDAFRAAGYAPDLAARFMTVLRSRVEEARRTGGVN